MRENTWTRRLITIFTSSGEDAFDGTLQKYSFFWNTHNEVNLLIRLRRENFASRKKILNIPLTLYAIHFINSNDDWLIDFPSSKWFHYFNAVARYFMSLALKTSQKDRLFDEGQSFPSERAMICLHWMSNPHFMVSSFMTESQKVGRLIHDSNFQLNHKFWKLLR